MALFFCLPRLIAPERRAILSNVSLAGVEGHLTHCGQGSWVPRAPVSDTYQDNKLITGSWCLPVGQLLRPNAAPAGHHNWEHSQPLFICLGYCNKIPHMGPLKQQAFILSQSEGWKSEIMVSISLACRWSSFLYVLTWSSLCVCVCILISSYKDIRQIGLGPILVTLFYLNCLLKGPVPKYSLILRRGVWALKWILKGHTAAYNTPKMQSL